MDRRTLLERIGVVATTGVLVGCLDDGTAGNGGPGAGGDDGQSGNGDGDSGGNGDSSGNGTDDGSASNGGGSDGDDPDGEGTDGTGDGSDGENGTGSGDENGDDENGDGELEDKGTENGDGEGGGNESVGAEEDSAFSARDGRSSVETTSADCFSGGDDEDHAATVAFEDDRLVVTGHLQAPDPCHEATLEAAAVRDGAVEIEIGLESTDGLCTECVGRIEYEARVELADGAPDEVVVYHRSDDERTEVATATR